MNNRSLGFAVVVMPALAFASGVLTITPVGRANASGGLQRLVQEDPCETPGQETGKKCGSRQDDPCLLGGQHIACGCVSGVCKERIEPQGYGLHSPNGDVCLKIESVVCAKRWPCTSNQQGGGCTKDEHCIEGSPFVPVAANSWEPTEGDCDGGDPD